MDSIDKLRKDDFLYCFWRAGEGFLAWLVNRQDELFLFMIKNMQRMSMTHMPFRSGDQVESIGVVFQMLGMQEYTVFCNVNQIKAEDRLILDTDFAMFDEVVEQERKAHEEMLEKQKEEQEKAQKAAADQGEGVPRPEQPGREPGITDPETVAKAVAASKPPLEVVKN